MKHLTSLVTIVTVLAMAAFLNAAPSYRGGGGKASNGIEGTVGEMNGNNFTMTVTMGGKEGKPYTWVVKCDANTKFMSGGQKVSASAIKPGVHVAVQGGQNGHDLMANTVTIGEAHKGK